MPLDFNELRQLLLTLAQTDITELTLKSDDFELTVRKAAGVSPLLQGTGSVTSGVASTPLTQIPSTQLPGVTETITSLVVDPGVNPMGQAPGAIAMPNESKSVEVISPMVGTFYRAPSPSEAPFVELGDRVKVGQTVCIIEAMKLMNEIETEISGQIVEILVENGQPIEYGQALMRVNPS